MKDRPEVHKRMLEKIPDNTQIRKIIHITRDGVTIVSYLKCNWSASKRSSSIAVMVKNDAPHRNEIKVLKTTQNIKVSWGDIFAQAALL